MQHALPFEFTFAGFRFPRYLATDCFGPDALRKQAEQRKVTGGYYVAPTPDRATGKGFYLSGDAGDGAPARRIETTGDAYRFNEYGDTIEGIIARLPHGRFLAGWTMGQGMASELAGTVYDDEDEARYAAKEEARAAADVQAEYEAEQDAPADD